MEELNLGDLDFDTSSLQLFDETPVEENKPEVGDEKPAEEVKEDKPVSLGELEEAGKNNTDGDDDAKASQEIVADQSKDTNQVQTGDTPPDGDGSNSSSPKLNETEQLYSNLAAEFKAKGVLPELDIETIKSLEDIENAIQAKIDGGLTNKQKVLEEAISKGAPLSEIEEKVNTIERLKQVTPEYLTDERNIEFRRTAIVQDFIQKGYDEKRSQAMAQRSIDAGSDIEDAKFALEALIEAEQEDLEFVMNEAREKEQKNLNSIKDYISKNTEVIPDIPLTDSQKDELYNQITTDIGDGDNAFMKAQREDPTGSRIKLEAIFYLTKGLTDFSVFGAKQQTKMTNKLENLIRGAKFTGGGTIDTDVSDKNSNFILSDLKDLKIE